MCGLLLWYDRNQSISLVRAAQALHLQNHRGPDRQRISLFHRNGESHTCDLNEDIPDLPGDFRLAMGHNRLSIIDLSTASDQPMFSEDRKYAVIFNGAIYNYIELRQELEALGERFRSTGDTEVLLKALRRWGIQAVHKFNGMWAFAFFDIDRQQVFLSRDRYGKKPLFYYHDENTFVAASEYKTIFAIAGKAKRVLNLEFIGAYLCFNFWPTWEDGQTVYQDIKSLGAGCTMTLDIRTGGRVVCHDHAIENYFFDRQPRAEELAADVQSAVRVRLRSDVPIGIFVSGGIDSTLVASFANQIAEKKDQIAWYTAKIEDSDDIQYARMAARSLGVKLIEVPIPYFTDAVDIIKKMLYHYEIPLIFGGISVSAYSLYAAMARDGVRVVLDGTGGDEIFGGYFKEYRPHIVNSYLYALKFKELREFLKQQPLGLIRHMVRTLPKSLFLDLLQRMNLKNLLPSSHLNYSTKLTSFVLEKKNLTYFNNAQHSRLGNNNHYALRQIQVHDLIKGMMPVWLYMIDRNSMAHSIEARAPFLDYRLAKYVGLPMKFKIKDNYGKFALRNIMPTGVDSRVTWRKNKQGFPWEKNNFIAHNRVEIRNAIGDSQILRKIFNIPEIQKEWDGARDRTVPFDDYMLRFYSVAALEKMFACTI